MTLKEMKKKYLGLIEELNPNQKQLTDDPDITAKQNDVINQIMFEMARFKKIPKYVEKAVSKGDLITFADIEKACGYEVYQINMVSGIEYTAKANGTVYLGVGDSPENWHEITTEEYKAIQAEQETAIEGGINYEQ